MSRITCTNVSDRSDLIEVNDPEVVERQLQSTCLKLNETEVNIKLFKKMLENGIATNDVRNFVTKQAKLKSTNQELNLQLLKNAMKSKYTDACRVAHMLRRKKNELIYRLKTAYSIQYNQ